MPRRPQVTLEQKQQMADLYLEGMHIGDIARHYDRSHDTVLRALKKYSAEYNRKKSLPIDDIVKKYNAGRASISELARDYRVGHYVIRRKLLEASVNITSTTTSLM